MTFFLRTLYSALAGAWGGFLAWLLLDRLFQIKFATLPTLDAAINGLIVGACIGGLIAVCEGCAERRGARLLAYISMGTLAGIIGGTVGVLVADALYQAMAHNPVSKVAGWGLFGICVGLAGGIATRSKGRMVQGALGGVLGGALGGYILTLKIANAPLTSRALGFVLLGLLVGLCIGIARTAFRRAWLQVISSGKYEGKEFALDKALVTIGRDDRHDIGLYSDQAVALDHAHIELQPDGQFILMPEGAHTPVFVNGQLASRHILQQNDRITVGNSVLQVHFQNTTG